MIKKLFSILLVFVLLCSNVCTAFADLDIEQQDNIVDSDNIILGNASLNNEDLVINGQKNEPDELLLVDNNNTIVEFSEGIRLVEKNAVEYEAVTFYVVENKEKKEIDYIVLDDHYSFENLMVGSVVEFHVSMPDDSEYTDYVGTTTITEKEVKTIEFELVKKKGCNLSCEALKLEYSDNVDLGDLISYDESYDGTFSAQIVESDECIKLQEMKMTAIAIGNAIISVKATGSRKYNSEEILIPVTVEAKNLGRIRTSQIAWSNTAKIYDANTEIHVDGIIQVGIEAVSLEALVLADSPSVGNHTSTISTFHDDEDRYVYELDTDEGHGPSVQIRQATAEIYVDSQTVMYGDDAWKKLIRREVPNWGDNWIHATVIGNEELQDELDHMSGYADIRIAYDSYLPGIIKNAIQVYAKDPEGSNFHFIANEDADITVLNEYMTDEELWGRISISEAESRNVFMDLDKIWTRKGGYLKFIINDVNSIYDRIIFFINGQRYFNGISVLDDVKGTVQLGSSRYPNVLSDSDLEDGVQPAIIPNKIFIDNTCPEVQFDLGSYQGGELPFARYQKTGYKADVKVSDDESGIAFSKYRVIKIDDPAYTEETIRQYSSDYESWDDLTGEVVIPGTESGYYLILVVAEDHVGNSVIAASNGVVIDISDPVIEMKGIEDKVYESLSFLLHYQDAGGAGIETVDVVVHDQLSGLEETIYHADSPDSSEIELTVPEEFNSNSIQITATIVDKSGNSFFASRMVKIDKTEPEISVSYDHNDPLNDKYFNTTRTMTVTFKERNFDPETTGFNYIINGVKHVSTVNDLSGQGIRLVSATDSQMGESEYTDDRTITYIYSFGDSGQVDSDYKVVPYIRDKAGNECHHVNYGNSNPQNEFVIDEVPPVIEMAFYDRKDTLFDPGDLYSRVPLYARFSVTERNFTKNGISTSISGTDYNGQSVIVPMNGNWDKRNYETNLFRVEAKYRVSATYTDLAGNKAEVEPCEVVLDWSSPSGKIITRAESVTESSERTDSSYYGTFTNKVITATYQASDTVSGLAYVMYAIYNPGHASHFSLPTVDELPTLDWKNWTTPITLSPDSQGIIYMRAADYAGNVVYINSTDGFVTEATANTPTIEIDTETVYNSNTAFRINVEDPETDGTYSGLKSVRWQIKKDGTVTQSGNYDAELTQPKIKYLNKAEVINAQLNNSNNVEILVEAWDYSGNYNQTSKQIVMDATPPEVSVSFPDQPRNGKYFNKERVMTLRIRERNFDPQRVLFNLSVNGTRRVYTIDQLKGHGISVISHQDTMSMNDSRTNTYQIRFGEGTVDIDYDVDISVSDIAGNENAFINYSGFATTSFTVDKIAPKIDYSFYEMNVPVIVSSVNSTPYYTKNQMTASIVIDERNHSRNNLSYNLSGTDYARNVVVNNVPGTWTDSTSHIFTLNSLTTDANYTIWANYTDLAGNTASLSPRYFTIDGTAPQGSLSINGSDGQRTFSTLQNRLSYSIFSSRNISVSYTSSDATSGVESTGFYVYTPNGQSVPNTNTLRTFNWSVSPPTVSVNSKSIVYMRIVDHAGNIRYVSSDGMIADDTAASPQINIQSASDIYNKDAKIEVSVIDPEINGSFSGLKRIEWTVQNNGVTTQSGNFNDALKKERTQSYTGSITVKANQNNSNNVTIFVETEDYAGNTARASSKLAFDTTIPRIQIGFNNNNPVNGKYFNSPRQMTVTFTERNFDPSNAFIHISVNGRREEKMQVDQVSGYGISRIYQTDSQGDSDNRTISYTYQFGDTNIPIDADYRVSASITDAAGNTSSRVDFGNSSPQGEFTIDQIAPVLNVQYKNGNGSTVAVSEREGNNFEQTPVTPSIKVTERNFSKNNVSITTNATDASKHPISVARDGTWTSNGDVHEYLQTFSKDGLYSFECSMTDLAGNKASYSRHYFCVDTTPPSGSIHITGSDWDRTADEYHNRLAFRIFTKSRLTATQTSSDATSGVKQVDYYLYKPNVSAKNTFDGLSIDQLSRVQWEKWSGTLTINPNTQVVIYARVMDNAGNVTYINSEDGIISETTDPSPTIFIEMDDDSIYYNKDVNFRIHVVDNEANSTYSGLKSVRWTVSSDGKLTGQGNYNHDLSDPTARVQTLNKTETIDAKKNSSNNVLITVEAEDYAGNTSKSEKRIRIDTIKPVINVKFDTQTPLNKMFYRKSRTATVTVTEENFDENFVDFQGDGKPGKWTHNKDNHTCTVSFDKDGYYTFGVTVTDLADNVERYTNPGKFVVDTVKPSIHVQYDKTNESGYYNEPRTAVIAVFEKNFYEDGFSYSPKEGFTLKDWVHKKKTNSHSTMIEFDKDGTYSFKLICFDLAGNMADEYTQKSFIIDQTPPSIRFDGIENNAAIRDDANIVIEYSDENFDEDLIEVTLEGATHEKKLVDGKISVKDGIGYYTVPEFARDKEIDDVYKLTARVTDLAGNINESSLNFSINRFGSVYTFDDSTKEVLDKYYLKEGKPLTIYETNIDGIQNTGITVGLNGESRRLEQDKDYTATCDNSDSGHVVWKYEINASNFIDEGIYEVRIESVDEAGNRQDNSLKDKPITFVVDKSPPNLVIAGIENNSEYEDSQMLSISVTDNISMNDVRIMLNNKMVEKYESIDIKEHNGRFDYTLDGTNEWQYVEVIAKDSAGNEISSNKMRIFISKQFKLSKSLILIIGLIAAVVLGIMILLIVKRKRRLN